MSFELEGVNQFSAEVEQDSAVQPQQPPANPVAEELNDTELDAIAGGWAQYDYLNWTAVILDDFGGFDPRIYKDNGFVGKKVG